MPTRQNNCGYYQQEQFAGVEIQGIFAFCQYVIMNVRRNGNLLKDYRKAGLGYIGNFVLFLSAESFAHRSIGCDCDYD